MTQKRPSIYEQAREVIRGNCRAIIETLFTSPGAEWRGQEYWTLCPFRADTEIGSFSINGATGLWLDFAGSGGDQDKGDLIDLVGLANGYGKKSRKAAELICEQFGGMLPQQPIENAHKKTEIEIETPPITDMCPEFESDPDYITQYVPGFIIARWDARDGKDKIIRPFTYCGGRWQSKRPTGWLPLAPFDKSRQVVVVEGEKCYMLAMAADVNATTWHGGTGSVKRGDWSALTGCDVVIWPDNDEPGHGAADWLQNHLAEIASSVSRVIPDPAWPEKYDIADALADSIDVGKIIFDARKIVKTPELATPVAPVTIPREKFTEYTTLENPPTLQKIEEIVDAIRDLSGKEKGDLSSFACVRYLIDLDYDFKWLVRWDDAKRQITFSDNYQTVDEIYTAILNRCALYGMSISMQTRRDVVDTIISRPQNRFNSIMDELAKIEAEFPDENPEALLDEWIGNFIIDGRDLNDTEEAATIEHHREIWKLWFTKTAAHLHGAFTKYAQLPADIVPVLVGPQGCGKSTLCKLLSMDENRFYVDLGDKTGRDLGTPDCLRLISGMIIAELGEMISLRKSEIETVKSFISATEDSYTPKYKEGKLQIPRTASFIGTSNPEQFLQDMTGNRRFYPLKIRAVSPELTLGEYGKTLVRKMYATFSRIGRRLVAEGKQAIIEACKCSPELDAWLTGARDQATEVPVVVERIIECVEAMQAETMSMGGFTSSGRPIEYCKFVSWEIAEKVFGAGQGTRADRNFGRWCGKVLEGMGYEKSTIKKHGGTMRGWKKHISQIKISNEAQT